MEKDRILLKMAKTLAHESGKDEEVLLFALRLVKTSVMGYTLLFIVSWIFGVWQYAFAAGITAALFRVFAGGAHASAPIRCSIIGAVVFTSIGLAVNGFYSGMSIYQFAVLLAAVFLVSLYMFYLYVPADTPGKPITSKVQRAYLRVISFSLLVMWSAAVCYVFVNSRALFVEKLVVASVGGLCWQAFTLTPPGYFTFERFDVFLKLIMERGLEG